MKSGPLSPPHPRTAPCKPGRRPGRPNLACTHTPARAHGFYTLVTFGPSSAGSFCSRHKGDPSSSSIVGQSWSRSHVTRPGASSARALPRDALQGAGTPQESSCACAEIPGVARGFSRKLTKCHLASLLHSMELSRVGGPAGAGELSSKNMLTLM